MVVMADDLPGVAQAFVHHTALIRLGAQLFGVLETVGSSQAAPAASVPPAQRALWEQPESSSFRSR